MKTFGWCSSSGRLVLTVTEAQSDMMPRSGACDGAVWELVRMESIDAQTDQWDAKTLAAELKEYGAWDDDELSDHETNIERMVWIAVSDINDNRDECEATE